MIIHARIKYSIHLIIPLILIILSPAVSAVNDNRISEENSNSMEAFKQAIRINPDDAEAHINLGSVYVVSGMYEEAISAYKQALRINPDDTDAHIKLGAVYVISDMYEEAIEAHKQAVRIKPDSVAAHCWLGLIYVSLNDKGSALEQYNIIKRLDHERANELYNMIH